MISRFGCIYKFESNKVLHNDAKPKYHIALCVSDGTFLFINSNPFEDSFKIDNNDWADMPNEESFVSCNRIIRYPREYFLEMTVTVCGKLNDDCITRLRKHLPECDSLETADLNYATKIFDENVKTKE